MQEIILFKTDDQDYPLEIIDIKGEKWVTRKQLESALGVGNLAPLHARLFDKGELKENIHFSYWTNDALVKSRGNQTSVIYSYRGIIRIAMASEGRNAVAFRDWAETALYEIMTTGSYISRSDSQLLRTAADQEALQRIAVAHAGILEVLGITGNAAVIAVNNKIKQLTQGAEDPLGSTGNTYLIADTQEQLFTPTEIGKKVGLSAVNVNKRLIEAGFQVVNEYKGKKIYELTEKGKVFGQYLDTGKKHSNGQPIRAVKWFGSLVNVHYIWQ